MGQKVRDKDSKKKSLKILSPKSKIPKSNLLNFIILYNTRFFLKRCYLILFFCITVYNIENFILFLFYTGLVFNCFFFIIQFCAKSICGFAVWVCKIHTFSNRESVCWCSKSYHLNWASYPSIVAHFQYFMSPFLSEIVSTCIII